jgi:hypothetical protein
MSVVFGRFIGEDSFTAGGINSIVTDETGKLYVMSSAGSKNQNMDTLRVYAPDGKYLRTLIPGPADLVPERAKAWARWDESRKSFIPRNRRSQLPEFYPWRSGARLLSASTKGGIVLIAGVRLYRMAIDGGDLRGPFPMWGKKKPPNPKWNTLRLAVSPDGRYVYYSNIAGTKYKPRRFSDTNPKWPQGRVYRQDTGKPGQDPQRFYDLKLPDWNKKKYWLPDAWNKRTAAYGLAVDGKGHLYICDLVNHGIEEVDPEGKKVSFTPVPWPERLHVDTQTGNYYVMARTGPIKPGNSFVWWKLLKVVGRGADRKIAASMKFPRGMGSAIALGRIDDRPVIWIGGANAMMCLRDAGDKFEKIKTAFKPRPGAQKDWNRIAVDYGRDEIYTSDGANLLYRYDGRTGKGGVLKRGDKPMLGVDIAVGYDGLLYMRTGRSFAGPLARFTRELKPAPFSGGSHVLTKFIYSRFGVGYCEKGLGVGPRGECYINFMYGWNKYFVAGFGPDGKPVQGKYLVNKVARYPESAVKSKAYPPGLNTAVVGPVPAASGGIRVDLAGNIYVGIRPKPRGFKPPAGFEKDPAYATWTGSIVKFGPEGGTVLGVKDASSKMPDAPRIAMFQGKNKFTAENALAVYGGVAPFSGAGWGGMNQCCVCRVPRFDVDRHGRVCFPNAVTNSVTVVDNAGNRIIEFGAYGNFDSQYVNPDLKAGREGKPTVSGPGIPFAWVTGVGVSDKHFYANDTYNRRAVRVDKTWTAAETCDVAR